MDPRFLRYYNQELKHVRESAGEFAKAFPKIAGRLGLESFEVGDPYVERLIEAFAFLAARVQLKLDARFPDFTQHLLQLLFPTYQAQKPAMLVAQVKPMDSDPILASGYLVPRHTVLRSRVGAGDRTPCEFRTAHDITLWPIELTAAAYFASDSQMAADGWGGAIGRARAGIKLSLHATAGLAFQDVRLNDLVVHLAGPEDLPVSVFEHIIADNDGFLVRAKGDKTTPPAVFSSDAISAIGLDDNQALLPVPQRQFRGYRLLQEYFCFPQRYLFLQLTDLQRFLPSCNSTEIEILILVRRSRNALISQIRKEIFLLHCTPAVNLVERQADRIVLKPGQHEYTVSVDRTRPYDFEVYSVEQVQGYSAGNQMVQRFLPYYGHADAANSYDDVGYFVTRTEPRLLSGQQRQKGTRTSYVGSETLLSLVEARGHGHGDEVRQIGLSVLCTNRDLSLTMPLGRPEPDFDATIGGPIQEIRCVVGPSRPRPALGADESSWRLISLLSLNSESLAQPGQDASALRELLRLLGDSADASINRQIEAVQSLEVTPVVRQMPVAGAISFGRGLQIRLNTDENGFEGLGVFLLGMVLDQFFGRYVSMNTFTELVLTSEQRNEIHRWTARTGIKPLI